MSAAYGIKQEHGWVARLQEDWQASNPSVRIVNASVSGATTAAGLNRMPELLQQYRPRWLVLELGGNDGLQGKPIPYIRDHLKQMIQMAQRQDTEVFLVGMRLPPNLGKRYVEPFFALYGELANEFQVAHMPFLLEGVAGAEDRMQDDGVHPTTEGQKVIFKTIEPLLRRWVSQSSSRATLDLGE